MVNHSIIARKSVEMLRRSFEKQTYRFAEVPEVKVSGSFGVYVNVPICRWQCAFCPFYKELYSEEIKDAYLSAILKEVEESSLSGQASWIYFGGGTPNILTVEELSLMVETLRNKVSSSSWGIELHPALLTREYLDGLSRIGFTKISLGLESLDADVVTRSGRKISSYEFIKDAVDYASRLGLWVNTDIMIGLSGQTGRSFLEDTRKSVQINPSQITIYPYMVIRGVKMQSSMTNLQEFRLIEAAGTILREGGYTRKGVWIFAKGDNVYDSSRDELVEDYVGFGPAAFSAYGKWKVVNPELEAYLKSNGTPMAFVAPKTPATDDWRRFARMLYDLRGPRGERFPGYIQGFITLLKMCGYIRGNKLTPKGIMFAHEVTKSVVEALPFPVQNPEVVINYAEYLEYIRHKA